MCNRVGNILAFAALAVFAPLAVQAQTVQSQLTFGTNFMLGVAANPATNQIYAVASSGTTVSDTLEIIDGGTDTVSSSVTLPVGAYLPAVNILTNQVYVATCNYYVSPQACTVTVVDGDSGAIVTSIPVTTTSGNGLTGIAVDPITAKVYVANGSDNVIDIINGYTNQLTGTISLGGLSPQGITFNPIYRRLYVTFGSSQVDIINPMTKAIIGTVTVGTSTYNAAANWATGNVFVTDAQYSSPTASVLSSSGSLLAQVTTSSMPWGVDVDPVTNRTFVADSAFNMVTAIDGSTNTATSASPIYNVPAQFVAVNFGTAKVYVTGASTLTVLSEQ